MDRNTKPFYFIGWPATFMRWGWYLLVSILLWFALVYVNQGYISLSRIQTVIEISLFFTYIESLYWSHLLIINKLLPKLRRLPFVFGDIIEVFLVCFAGFICEFVFNILPIVAIYGDVIFSTENARNLRTGIIMGPIISLVLYYFVERVKNRTRLQKEKLHISNLEKENYRAQLQTLKNQLSPHFLFNNLNVLASIIPEDADKALKYIYRLSDLYRHYLQSINKELVALKEELKMLDAYRYLLETRFEERVEINFDITDKSGYLPFGALQECVDNAIKHNAPTKRRILIVRLVRNQNTISISNTKLPRKKKVLSTATGWQNIVKRYQLLSKQNPRIEEDEQNYTVVLPLLKKPDV